MVKKKKINIEYQVPYVLYTNENGNSRLVLRLTVWKEHNFLQIARQYRKLKEVEKWKANKKKVKEPEWGTAKAVNLNINAAMGMLDNILKFTTEEVKEQINKALIDGPGTGQTITERNTDALEE